MFGFSNKAHDGFLGNAVIGEWCNLGAGCVASNLKNPLAPGGQHLEIIFDLSPVEKENIIDVFDNVDFVSEQFTLGSCLRSPIALGEHSTVNMGTHIYPGTSLGPWCKVGGELNNVVMFGFSNKAHDGFLGNAVIGEHDGQHK